MCGIVGVVGHENAKEIILSGLEKLEYRGYDSAGLFLTGGNHEACLFKSVGRIAHLRTEVPASCEGNIGIGHTRWATHGKPSQINAHPHRSKDGRFILVHNGVIDNFEELKKDYLDQSLLVSETDTEVLVQLIATFAMNEQLTAKEALIKTLQLCHGSYALALIDCLDPTVLHVAKYKSPLIIGCGSDFNLICSDPMAMLAETTSFIEIEDHEIATISKRNITIENFLGKSIERQPFTIEMAVSEAEKGNYPHYMVKEIEEQPGVIRQIMQTYQNNQGELTINADLMEEMCRAEQFHIVACGTSWHAGWIGKHLLEMCVNKPVVVHLASELAYQKPLIADDSFFIFLSQSGETADSRHVLTNISHQGLPTLTITNVLASSLAREAKYVLPLVAGPEIAVASTKAYTAQISVLAIVAKAVGSRLENPIALNFSLLAELSRVANAIEQLLAEQENYQKVAKRYFTQATDCFYIGRGLDYFVALEAALKLKEVSYIHCEGIAAGELKHGSIALIEEGTPVIGLLTSEHIAQQLRSNVKEVESRGANSLLIVSEELAKPGDQLLLPKVHPLLRPLISVIPTQLLAYYAAVERGLDVDKPRNLAKSVTVE